MTMRALTLDFQRVRRPVPWSGFALLLAAVATLTLLALQLRQVEEQLRTWEASSDAAARQSARAARAPSSAGEQALRAQLQEVRHANQVVRQLALPWNTLFDAVESSGSKDIALLLLEPELQGGSVRIAGEARDFETLLAYVKELGTRPAFTRVLLQNHQYLRDVPEMPVRFTLLAQWKAGAP